MKRSECYLGKTVEVLVDRPLGSKHPRYEMCYPVNYGYVPGTRAGDGEPVDAYVLDVSAPVERYRGVVIGIIHRKDDVEDKLVVADSAGRYSKEQIRALTEFQERYFDSDIQCLK